MRRRRVATAPAISVVGRAASATFGAILYRSAATGEAVGPLGADELAAAARSGS